MQVKKHSGILLKNQHGFLENCKHKLQIKSNQRSSEKNCGCHKQRSRDKLQVVGTQTTAVRKYQKSWHESEYIN